MEGVVIQMASSQSMLIVGCLAACPTSQAIGIYCRAGVLSQALLILHQPAASWQWNAMAKPYSTTLIKQTGPIKKKGAV
jgi:hypothetical protein